MSSNGVGDGEEVSKPPAIDFPKATSSSPIISPSIKDRRIRANLVKDKLVIGAPLSPTVKIVRLLDPPMVSPKRTPAKRIKDHRSIIEKAEDLK